MDSKPWYEQIIEQLEAEIKELEHDNFELDQRVRELETELRNR